MATERMFAELMILETTASVTLALRQYKSASGSAPPAASEVVEAVPAEPATGAESAAVVPAPTLARKEQEASLPQPAEAAASATVPPADDAAVDVAGEARPSSPRLVASTADEVLAPDEPAASPLEHVAPEGTTRARPRRSKRLRRTRARFCHRAQRAVRPRLSSSPAPRGRPPSSPTTMPRMTRRLWRAVPWSAGWSGRAARLMS
jgi:hypothetical protein